MKKITLLLMLLCASSYSQEIAVTENGKKVLLNKNGTYKVLKNEEKNSEGLIKANFKTVGEGVIYSKDDVIVINGDEKNVLVKFTFAANSNVFSNVSIESLNNMLSVANIKSMFQMKSRRTYIPKRISFFYSDKEERWVIATEYTAQNDYGATKDGNTYTTFSIDGTFEKIIN